MNTNERQKLWDWYQLNQRPLPWRLSPHPYSVWVSETMLQQTTVQTVIPYFEKFLQKYPHLKDLAEANQNEVLSLWAGLGYYSRARNLHKAAQIIDQLGEFPRSYQELMKLPGFGPYISRAVSSIAFGERVGVVDGNVIRVLSRFHSSPLESWKTQGRQQFQSWADAIVIDHPPGEMNQALMDLGSTICTPTQPSCSICPLHSACLARREGTPLQFPYKKPKRPREIWYWKPQVQVRSHCVRLVMNEGQLPFLKQQWVLPGAAIKRTKKPRQFAFKHSITHHDIFVIPVLLDHRPIKPSSSINSISKTDHAKNDQSRGKWVKINELSQWIPASLIKKTLLATEKMMNSDD